MSFRSTFKIGKATTVLFFRSQYGAIWESKRTSLLKRKLNYPQARNAEKVTNKESVGINAESHC